MKRLPWLLIALAGVALAQDPIDLNARYEQYQREAKLLAGSPDDFARRSAILYSIYKDSGGNFTFPLLEMHGALWASGHYQKLEKTQAAVDGATLLPRAAATAGRFISPFSPVPILAQGAANAPNQIAGNIAKHMGGFKTLNSEIFGDIYSLYYFSKRYGKDPGAQAFFQKKLIHRDSLPDNLLAQLNTMHDAAKAGKSLTEAQKRALYVATLRNEQRTRVHPGVQRIMAGFGGGPIPELLGRPTVRFSYFPPERSLRFTDFSSMEQRVSNAILAHDIINGPRGGTGWLMAERSLANYGLMSAEMLRDPMAYANRMRRNLSDGTLNVMGEIEGHR